MDAECIRQELTFRVSRSSGPGGQHAQKSSTRVEALFDVEASGGLSEAERGRVVERLGAVVRAIAQDERSQLRNRELATERVLEQVRKAARRGASALPPSQPPARGSGASTRSAGAARPRSSGSRRRSERYRRSRSSTRESTPYRSDRIPTASTATTKTRKVVMPSWCIGPTISANRAMIDFDYGT